MEKTQLKTLIITAALGCAAVLLLSARTQAKAKAPVQSIRAARTVYVSSARGDQQFVARLKNEMREMGLSFVSEKADADAIMAVFGEYDDGEFFGQLKFFNQSGKLIWKAEAKRPRNSNYMAYLRLADQLRRARQK